MSMFKIVCMLVFFCVVMTSGCSESENTSSNLREPVRTIDCNEYDNIPIEEVPEDDYPLGYSTLMSSFFEFISAAKVGTLYCADKEDQAIQIEFRNMANVSLLSEPEKGDLDTEHSYLMSCDSVAKLTLGVSIPSFVLADGTAVNAEQVDMEVFLTPNSLKPIFGTGEAPYSNTDVWVDSSLFFTIEDNGLAHFLFVFTKEPQNIGLDTEGEGIFCRIILEDI